MNALLYSVSGTCAAYVTAGYFNSSTCFFIPKGVCFAIRTSFLLYLSVKGLLTALINRMHSTLYHVTEQFMLQSPSMVYVGMF